MRRALPYVAPFATFLILLGIRGYLPGGAALEYPLRVVAVSIVLIALSRGTFKWRLSNTAGSLVLGVAVFAIWVAPDLIWPDLRSHAIFSNALTGKAQSSLPSDVRADYLFLIFRIAGTALLVPIVEELFWRAWLMRYLVSPDFEKVPLGAVTAMSFIVTALLFASEHGPYWDVGLIAGFAYNWWMVRTKNVSDCILAHGVTNACLAVYVISAGQWKYWL